MTCAAGMAVRVIFGKNDYLRRAPDLWLRFLMALRESEIPKKSGKNPVFAKKSPFFHEFVERNT